MTRICPEPNCSRELEKYQRMCSECAEISRQLSLDIARHTYLQTDKGRLYMANYLKEYQKTPKRIAYNKEYEKTRLEYHKNYKRKRRAEKHDLQL